MPVPGLDPGIVAGIHVLKLSAIAKAWVAGTSPAMTEVRVSLGQVRTEGLGSVDAANIYGTYQAQGKVRKFVKN